MAMAWKDGHIERRRAEVDNTEDLGAVDLGSEVFQQREGVGINHSLAVQSTEICAWPGPAPWLGRQV